MRWKSGRRSSNVEDRRGQRVSGSAGMAGGALQFLPMLFRTKMGRIILIVGVVVFFGSRLMGIDLLPLLTGSGSSTVNNQPYQGTPEEDELAEFTSAVLATTEDSWSQVFRENGETYREPTLVLFTGQVQSACGMAGAAMGPFYCPADQKLYIDLSFFDDLARRHGSPGDFAQAYVVAHEVGHHVQTLLGISAQVRQAQQGRSKADANALSVKQELQADCFAGLWGHAMNAQGEVLQAGDLEEALTAASAIGDDRLQRESGGRVVPDSFTHGTSEQRVEWFRRGFESGDFEACDTFSSR